MNAGRALAWLNLAWNFGTHVVVRMPARALGRGDDDANFRAAVLPEGYVPLDAEARELLPAAMRCVNCGLCALAGTDLIDRPASAWEDAWTFVAGPSRSLDRAAIVAAGPLLAAHDEAVTAICPVGVPIDRMAAMLQRLAVRATAESGAHT